MRGRLDALFFTFLAIFAATAIVTLLGVIGVFYIRDDHLNWLLSAFLLELAGAVVQIFRDAPFFGEKPDIALSASNSIEVIDELIPQIEAVIAGSEVQADVNRRFGVIMRREGKNLVAFQRMQIITGDQLQSLSQEEKDAIQVHESQMFKLKDRWQELYQKRTDAKTKKEREKINQELRELGKDMKEQFQAILAFLIRQGAVLEDHYRHVSSIIDDLANA